MAAPAPTVRDLYTEEQVQEFLDMIRQGIGRHLAAQRIGSTGSQMKTLARDARDPVFAAEYVAAVEQGKDFYRDRLRAEARQRALARNGSDRILEVELATHGGSEYEHLRRDRLRVNGKIDHEHAVILKLDPAVLDAWPREKLLAFREGLAELAAGEVVDGEFTELPANGAERPSNGT